MVSESAEKTKFTILKDISKALVETHDIRSIANIMLDLAISYTDAEKGSFILLNEREHLYILTARGLPAEFVREYYVKLGEGIAGTVAKNRIPVLVEDIRKDPRFQGTSRDHYKTRSFVSCPIISKKNVLGVLNINDKKDGTSFTLDEFELLKGVANHAAIALENVMLLNQLQTKAAELEKINRKLIESSWSKNEFLTQISHELRTPLNSIRGAVYCLQSTENITENRAEFQEIIATETDKLIILVENLLNYLRIEDESRITDRTIVNLKTIFKELPEAQTIRNAMMQKGLQLKVTVSDDVCDIVGDKTKITQLFKNLVEGFCFYLEHGETIEITVQELDFVSITITLPRKLPKNAIPLHNNLKRVFQSDQPEHRLKLYLAWNIIEVHRWGLVTENMNHACRITLTVPKSTNERLNTLIDISMDSFAEYISERLNVDICSIMLGDDLSNELTVRGARGLDDDIIRKTRIKMGDKIAGWVALEGKPLFIEDIENDVRFAKKNIPQYTTKSLMSFPLKVGGRVVGVMNLNNKKTPNPFTDRDYATAESVSDIISRFIEQLYTGNYQEMDLHEFMASLDKVLPPVTAETRKKVQSDGVRPSAVQAKP